MQRETTLTPPAPVHSVRGSGRVRFLSGRIRTLLHSGGTERSAKGALAAPGFDEDHARVGDGAQAVRRGRFAPTPNGPLHLGSVAAALASHLSVRSRGGEWRVRIDDVDTARTVPGAADAILRELERLALPWDGPVVYQSANPGRYRLALSHLERNGWTFGCACTRREAGTGPYPGTCRDGAARPARSIRMRAPVRIAFRDGVQGDVALDLPRETGDFIVRRADRIPAYHLTAVVDDDALGVTEIVRGADLLASTGPQIHLRRALGLPEPVWAHVPVATTADGAKLAKSSAAAPSAGQPAGAVLRLALRFLGLDPPIGLDDPAALVAWGIRNFDLGRVPRLRNAPLVTERGGEHTESARTLRRGTDRTRAGDVRVSREA